MVEAKETLNLMKPHSNVLYLYGLTSYRGLTVCVHVHTVLPRQKITLFKFEQTHEWNFGPDGA